MTLDTHLLSEDTRLQDALAVLNHVDIKIGLVVSADGHLLRTLTDGDVRRALLDGFSLDARINDIPGQAPVTRPQNISEPDLLQAFFDESVEVIVIVDEDMKPVRLADRRRMTKPLFLSPPHMGDAERSYVQLAFDENYLAPAGSNLVAFEQGLKAVSGRQHALAVSSGTAGLHLCLRVLDIARGDRVYVSDMTFVASVQPILYEQATPVLIDCDRESWNMSPAALQTALERDAMAGTLPKAIIVVHLYGQSADMDAIMALADRFEVPVIEDAAESLGARYGNRASGAHGLLSVYSFNGNKIITTSGGGAIVSDRTDLIQKAQKLATQGRDPAEHYQHSEVSYNYRMSNVLAGIGRGQLEVLEERVRARREIHDRYREGLQDCPGISFQPELHGSFGNRWLTAVVLDPEKIAVHPYEVLRSLRTRGIETRPAWKPMHMQPLLLDCEFVPHGADEAVSSALFLQSFCLPSGSAMRVDEQERVISAFKSVVRDGEAG